MTTAIKAEPTAQINWMPALWVGLWLTLCYFPVFQGLVHQWQTDDDMGHGFFVPLIAGYIIWERRGALLRRDPAIADSTNRWGLFLIAWGALQLFVATLGGELFLQRTAFLFSLTGALLYLGGTRLLRALAFPLMLLLFMIPIPGIALKSITFPLQLLASRLAEAALELLGYPVVRSGNILELAGQMLSVAEACSGIRSLLSLSFFSLCYAYLFDPRVSMRWILLLATVPIAMLANAGRIVITGVVGEYNQQLASGLFHGASGWVIFVISIGLLMAIHKLCSRKRSRGELD